MVFSAVLRSKNHIIFVFSQIQTQEREYNLIKKLTERQKKETIPYDTVSFNSN